MDKTQITREQTFLCLARGDREITVRAELEDSSLVAMLNWKHQHYPGWAFVESWQ